MATNGCVNCSFFVEWTTQIPFPSIPRRSPDVILLNGIKYHLQLTCQQEQYYLRMLGKSKESKVVKDFTVTTFIRDSLHSPPKLIAYCGICNYNSTLLWWKSRDAILEDIPNILNIGKLIIICVFHTTDAHLVKKYSAHVSTQTPLNSVVSVDLQSLSHDFSTFLEDENFSDVKLICADRTFSTNMSVLAARSEVFATMFRKKMAEAKTAVVHIKDVDPEMLALLLEYMHSAKKPDLCEDTAHRLYEVADKYVVHGLRRACSDWMVKCQTTDNCLDLLVLAGEHSDENFKEAVAWFVAEHLTDLSVESWSTFSDKYPLLVLAVLKKRCEDLMPGAAKRAKTDFPY